MNRSIPHTEMNSSSELNRLTQLAGCTSLYIYSPTEKLVFAAGRLIYIIKIFLLRAAYKIFSVNFA